MKMIRFLNEALFSFAKYIIRSVAGFLHSGFINSRAESTSSNTEGGGEGEPSYADLFGELDAGEPIDGSGSASSDTSTDSMDALTYYVLATCALALLGALLLRVLLRVAPVAEFLVARLVTPSKSRSRQEFEYPYDTSMCLEEENDAYKSTSRKRHSRAHIPSLQPARGSLSSAREQSPPSNLSASTIPTRRQATDDWLNEMLVWLVAAAPSAALTDSPAQPGGLLASVLQFWLNALNDAARTASSSRVFIFIHTKLVHCSSQVSPRAHL